MLSTNSERKRERQTDTISREHCVLHESMKRATLNIFIKVKVKIQKHRVVCTYLMKDREILQAVIKCK